MVDCQSRSPPPVLKPYGAGLPGCGFYGMVGGDGVVVATPPVLNDAVISVLEGEASLDKMAEELKEWGLENWDWQLERLYEKELVWFFRRVRA